MSIGVDWSTLSVKSLRGIQEEDFNLPMRQKSTLCLPTIATFSVYNTEKQPIIAFPRYHCEHFAVLHPVQ